jgi:hypothetical protein
VLAEGAGCTYSIWLQAGGIRYAAELSTYALHRGGPDGLWGAEIRPSCSEAVFVDQSAESISPLDAV